ncbi:glycosyltransferase [Massilia niastensis]|uniref:glycosyltransferase n=1 Tax=Massilia niastensis TaxID=544911 RepID=UPI00035DE8E4|nr:glycosyltransferase [Massilia niastensis]
MLVLTSLYPYGQGEAFIAAELEHVARCFDHIELAPGFYDPDTQPRPERLPVNRGYADTRWGLLRWPRAIASLLLGLVKYRWADDLAFLLARGRKLDNIKELVRAVYRARMFERFLADQARQGKEPFDVIYFYWLVPEIMGALQFRKATGAATHIVCRAHRGDLYLETRPGGYAGLRRGIVAGIDDIYCISEHGSRYLGACFPALAAKFHLARLGVDEPGFLNAQPQGGPLSIVSCSFVIRSKRLSLIVDAIAHLLASNPDLQVRWTHVGDGPLLDEVRAHAASRLGERAQVIFKGYLAHAGVMALYRDEPFDLILNVSDSEGIPVSLMEASSAGIPLVATDVGGSAEIANAGTGVLLPADADPATIAAALLRFNDRATSLMVRRAARWYWSEHFNAATNYARFGLRLAGHERGRAAAELSDAVAFAAPRHEDPAAG